MCAGAGRRCGGPSGRRGPRWRRRGQPEPSTTPARAMPGHVGWFGIGSGFCLSTGALAVGLKSEGVTLGRGSIGGTLEWSATMRRARAGRSGTGRRDLRPCISVSGWPSGEPPAESNTLGLCVLSPPLRADLEPLIVEAREPGKQAIESAWTAVAIGLAPSVHRIVVTDFDGAKRGIAVSHLTREQADSVRLARLGYVAFGVNGPFCVDRIVSFDKRGRRIGHTGGGRCPLQEFTHGG
jgi:hypothetical protein